MKTLLALLLASTLAACSTTPLQPVPYSINAPCLSSIMEATVKGDDANMAGIGIVVYSALSNAGFTIITNPLIEELGEICASSPELSFKQAANVVKDKHSI